MKKEYSLIVTFPSWLGVITIAVNLSKIVKNPIWLILEYTSNLVEDVSGY